MSRKVLVFAEVKNDQLRNVSFEAIAAGKVVAEGGEVVVAVLGDDVKALTDKLYHYGADAVITVEHASLAHYTTDAYTQAALATIEAVKPEGIVMGHTSIGKDITPRLAARLQSGLISDVTTIEIAGGNVVCTRPIYSGKAFEKKIITDGILFLTVRPNNIASLPEDLGKTGEVQSLEVDITDLRTVIQNVVRKATEGVDLSEAKVVVAGGRGVKSAEGFAPLKELADLLQGAVGASRGACDADYCDYSLQIGQTGKVITPDLYIACGISGAIQHLAGMSNSKVIVAINKDPEATIFKVADYGIVGDLFEVVPLLTEEFKRLMVASS